MSTVLISIGFVVALIVLASFIPGLKLLMDPIIKLVFMVIGELTKNGMEWVIWAAKRLYSAHLNIIVNLISTRESLDPTEKVRRSQ
jgi:hypothetical protein